MAKPNICLTANRSMVQYKVNGAEWVVSLFCTSILAAIFLPYFIVLLRGTLQPILPLVSQAAGSPPQSGIFSILLTITSIIALIGLISVHAAIRLYCERLEVKRSFKLVTSLNKVLLISGLIGICGIMMVAGYPMDFYRHHEDWYTVSLIPHFLGAASLFIGGEMFLISFTYIMSILHPEKTELKNRRLVVIAFIMFTASLHSAALHQSFMKEFNDDSRLKSCYNQYVQYDLQYIICSFLEWIFLIAFVVFFATIREEAKDMCITFTVSSLDQNYINEEEEDRVKNGVAKSTVPFKSRKIL